MTPRTSAILQCRLLAIEAKLEGKFAADYGFEYMMTILEGCTVMKGAWIFSTKANPLAAEIIFMARWVREGYSTIETMAYNNTYTDIGLTTVDVEHEVTEFEGPSWYSPSKSKGPKVLCAQCNKHKPA